MRTFKEWLAEAMAPAMPLESINDVAEKIAAHAKKYVAFQESKGTFAAVKLDRQEIIEVPGMAKPVVAAIKMSLSIEDFDPATNRLGNAFYRYSGRALGKSQFGGQGPNALVEIDLVFQKSAVAQKSASQEFTRAEADIRDKVAFTLTHELGHRQRTLPDGSDRSYQKVVQGRMQNLDSPANKPDPHWDAYQMHPQEVEANMHAMRSRYEAMPPAQRQNLTIDQLFSATLPAAIAQTYLRNKRYFLQRLAREGIRTKEMGNSPTA